MTPRRKLATEFGRFVLLAAAALCTLNAAAQPKRVALIIGNAGYSALPRLSAPVRDANAIGDVLEKTHGYVVMRAHNLNRLDMFRTIERFVRSAKGADSVVIYYSGHGVATAQRQNLLLPVDTPDLSERDEIDGDLLRVSVTVDDVVEKLAQTRAAVQLLVIDACRDIPSGLPRSKSVFKGMAPAHVESPNLLVSFATASGRTARDGVGASLSPYAEALASELRERGAATGLMQLLEDVAVRVEHVTAGRQTPMRYGNLRLNVCLTGICKVAATPLSSAAVPPALVETNRPSSDAVPKGRYVDRNGCLREGDGNFVLGFRSDCR
jgi:uncharacterized caspase-like protein